jgi:hypothetical protein
METKLKSKGAGRILLLFLWIGFVLSGLIFIFTIPYVYAYDFYYQYLSSMDQFLSTFNVVLYYITVVSFLVWIYKLHADILKYDPNYKVTPGGALIRIMIPFVNIWGLWNTFSNLSSFIKEKGLGENREGAKLYTLIFFLYLTLYTSSIFNRIYSRPIEVNDTLLLLALGIEVGMSIVFLMMVNIITRAINEVALNDNEDQRGVQEQQEQQEQVLHTSNGEITNV